MATHVEEPVVVVGVRGWETPRAAAGLDRAQQLDAVGALQSLQVGLDPLDGCRVEVGGDGTDSCASHRDGAGLVRPMPRCWQRGLGG